MKRRGKRTVTPKLRFPEFRDKGEWEEKKLGEVAVFYKGKGLPKSAITPTGKSQCIHYGELFTEYPDVIETVRSHTNSKEKAFLSVANDVLMPTSDVTPNGLAKACCVKLDNVILGGDILVIRANKKEVSGDFLARLIRRLEKQVLQLVSGSTVFHLYATSINKLALSLPKRPEQQKIAECLSSLDGLIAAEGRMLEALKAHKKGLMQQLFPQPGQTQPHLRFPEFRDKGEWEQRKLSELLPIGSSKRVHQRDWARDGVPFYRAREIVAIHNGAQISPLYISAELYAENVAKTGAISGGDLLVTGVGSIGVPYLVKPSDRFYFKDGNIIWLKNDESKITGRFLHLLYQTAYVQSQITRMAGVGTVGTYTIDNAKRTQVVFPCELIEQQRIADCLTVLDDRIAAQAAKIDALKRHKRGLMQQLFPAPEVS